MGFKETIHRLLGGTSSEESSETTTVTTERTPDPTEDELEEIADTETEDDSGDMLSDAAEDREQADKHGYRCPTCGFDHGHPESKHFMVGDYNVRPEIGDKLSGFTMWCHCGLHAVAALLERDDRLNMDIFSDEDELSDEEYNNRKKQIISLKSTARLNETAQRNIDAFAEALDERIDDR